MIVPKGDDVRVCVDMRLANKAIIREKHPLPTMDDMLPNLRNSKWYSKLDITNAFHQVEISESSRHITTFISKQGLFRYTRLMFGISCAPELFQKVMEKLLLGCVGCVVYIDDILIFAETETEHDGRLECVLRKLRNAGVKLNKSKSEIKVKTVAFLGHMLDENGVKPSEDRVLSIRNFKQPSSVEETRSFLGLINYVGRFIPHLSTLAEPLYRIIKKSNKFVWGHEQNKAYELIKNKMSSVDYLGYYNPCDVTHVIADASPVGLGAVIVQSNGGKSRIIAYANKTLTEVEKRYCQTEKEALAIVWAVERFHIYLFGKHFYLLTDHKPLQAIFGPRSRPSARIERWVLRLQSYDYSVTYITGKNNIADPLSRLCKTENHPIFDDQIESCIYELTVYSKPTAIPYSKIKSSSLNDEEIGNVIKALQSNEWTPALLSYKLIKDELAVSDGILIRGTRIVIPLELRDLTLTLGHEGHPGISVMKARLRMKVWWPSIDKEIEKKIKKCKSCLQVSLPGQPEPMKRRSMPDRPWQDLAIDFLGPLPSGHYIFVVVDYFSRYFEIKVMTSITTRQTIFELKDIFARFGIPFSITADNGPQFRSINREFKEFCDHFGIILYNTTPEWPQQNGLVERQNRGLLKRLKISQIEGSDWRADLLNYLLMYRSTPLVGLGKSPSELLFGRNIRDKIPQLLCSGSFNEFEGTIERDNLQKEKGKLYADNNRSSKVSEIRPGDTVLLKNKRENKLSPTFGSEEFLVMNKNGSELKVKSNCNGRTLNRNSSHALKISNQNEGNNCTEPQGEELINHSGNNRESNVFDETENVNDGFVGFKENEVSHNCPQRQNRSEVETIDSQSINDSQSLRIDLDQLRRSTNSEPELPSNRSNSSTILDPDSSESRPKRKRCLPAKFKDFIIGCNDVSN